MKKGWGPIIKALVKNRKKINSHSLSNEAVFTLGGETFVISGKKGKHEDK